MKGKKTWRLSKTLSRQTQVRPIEQDDVKYAWAAYKKGALTPLNLPLDMNAATFKTEFETYVLTRAHAAWTVSAMTRNGLMPVGFALGQWGPDDAFMFIKGIAWFPWASKRNIIEGTVDLFNKLRKDFPIIGFANDDHKPLYETCCMHGIMQRIGTSHSLGQRMAVFEGRN